MKTVTRYIADDGCEFAVMADCLRYETLLNEAAEIMRPLGSPVIHGDCYYQHNCDAFRRAHLGIVALLRREFKGDVPAVPDSELRPHKTMLTRTMQEGQHPLWSAWSRFGRCSFETCREYAQAYYAAHEYEAGGPA